MESTCSKAWQRELKTLLFLTCQSHTVAPGCKATEKQIWDHDQGYIKIQQVATESSLLLIILGHSKLGWITTQLGNCKGGASPGCWDQTLVLEKWDTGTWGRQWEWDSTNYLLTMTGLSEDI